MVSACRYFVLGLGADDVIACDAKNLSKELLAVSVVGGREEEDLSLGVVDWGETGHLPTRAMVFL